MASSPFQSRLAVSAFFFLPGLCFASWASRIPDISQRLGLNAGQLGQLLLAIPAGSLLSLPLAGWLVQSWGSRRTVLLASVLYAAFLPLLGWAGSFWTLAPCLALFGFAGNLTNISVNTQAIGVQQFYEKPIMGSFHGLWSLAGFLGGWALCSLAGGSRLCGIFCWCWAFAWPSRLGRRLTRCGRTWAKPIPAASHCAAPTPICCASA